ncbi:MAG TPA: serine hydrolase [Gemmatales bacterium]|nr:serine hydrolase [Gemmatales bacterium]
MRNIGCLGLMFLLAIPLYAQHSAEYRMRQAGTRLQTLHNKFDEADLQWFTPDFFQVVPREKLIEGLKYNGKQLGEIQRVRICRITDPWSGELELIGEGDKRMRVIVRLETGPQSRINYVLFNPIDMADDTWAKLESDLAKLPGKNGVSVWKLTTKIEKLFSRNATESLAVGSSLKLLILSLLCDDIAAGKRKWSDLVTLREEARSLPSGQLQDWPVGSPVTLHTLATLMLSRSDNTAADHLMLTLGREALEEHQKKVNILHPERNQPFLRTNELFKLKLVLTPQEAQSFLERTPGNKRDYLSELAKVPLRTPRVPDVPQNIDQIEWFFCTEDLARLMDRLRQSPVHGEVLPLLAITRPFDIDDFAWKYLGFKGGAEVGVLNLSLLGQLRSNSDWYAFSFTWNDSQKPLNEPLWIRFVERSLRLVERGRK